MWEAPVVKRSVLSVVCSGVGMSASGPSAQGLEPEGLLVVMTYGELRRTTARKMATALIRIARRPAMVEKEERQSGTTGESFGRAGAGSFKLRCAWM